jgi:3-phosphoshikimate 1-carboxyvinyltransferase
MEQLTLGPLTRASGTVRLPGSKSISNRVLLLSALATGETRVRDLLDSDDTRVMLEALKVLGVAWRREGNDCIVSGVGGNFPSKAADLFMGNAGTAIRPLTAALALQGGTYKLSGVQRMHERPIGDLVDGLRQVGASVDYLGTPGYPPLQINPAQIRIDAPIRARRCIEPVPDRAVDDVANGPAQSGRIEIEVVGELISKPYIEITLNLLARFGIAVERQGWERFILPARVPFAGRDLRRGRCVDGVVLPGGGRHRRRPGARGRWGMSSIQGDVRFADALNRMGANVMAGDNWIEVRGTERDDGRLNGIELDCNHIPDAAMTLAVAALFAEGTTTLTNIASWRVKETDRIAAMATELRKLGAEVEEGLTT